MSPTCSELSEVAAELDRGDPPSDAGVIRCSADTQPRSDYLLAQTLHGVLEFGSQLVRTGDTISGPLGTLESVKQDELLVSLARVGHHLLTHAQHPCCPVPFWAVWRGRWGFWFAPR